MPAESVIVGGRKERVVMFQWLFKRKPRKKVYHCNEDISPAMLECMQLCIERGGAVFGHDVNGRFVEDAPAEQGESAGTSANT